MSKKDDLIIPILNNHIHSIAPIGFVYLVDGILHFRFHDDASITLDMVYQIFGNVGIKVLDSADDKDGLYVIRSGQILEWSLEPGITPPRPSPPPEPPASSPESGKTAD